MNTQQVQISSTEFTVRQVILWAVLDHKNKDTLCATNENFADLFIVIGTNRVAWKETIVRQLPTEDLMAIFIQLERVSANQPTAKQKAPGGIILQ